MKSNNIKHRLIIKIWGILISVLFLMSCEKDQHVKPVPGSFEVSHQIPDSVPSLGGTYALTVDAGTNGWWIDTPDDENWITINRKYGSAKVVQDIVVEPNESGQQRTLSITVNGTNEDIIVIEIKQQG